MYQRRLCAAGASATAAKKIIAQVPGKEILGFPNKNFFLN
jgi:hypothetical protein